MIGRRSILALGAVAAAICLSSVVLPWTRSRPVPAPELPASPAAAPAGLALGAEVERRIAAFAEDRGMPPAPSAPRLVLRPGERLGYSFRLASRVSVEAPEEMLGAPAVPAGAERTSIELSFEGSLELRVHRAGDGPYLLGWRTRDARIDVRDARGGIADLEEARRRAPQELDHEVLTRTDDRGRILEFLFPAAMTRDSRNLVKGLVLSTRIVFPEELATEWTETEEDITGVLEARYRLAGRPGGLAKRKIRYREIRAREFPVASSGPRFSPEVRIEGGASCRIDAATGILLRLSSGERVSWSGEPLAARVEIESLAEFELRDRAIDDPAPGSLPVPGPASRFDSSPPGGPETRGGDAVVAPESEAAPSAEESFAELLAGLESARALEAAPAEVWRLFREAVDRLAGESRQVELAARAVREISTSWPAAQALLDALGNAGSRAAQEALLELAADPTLEPRRRETAASALSWVEHPVPGLDRSLERIADQEPGGIGSAALLALGAVASRLDSSGARDAVGRLRDRLDAAEGPREEEILLEAIGNSRQAIAGEIRHSVEARLEDPDPGIRSASVRALSNTPDPDLLAAFLGLAGHDPSPAVRARAVQALAGRTGPEVGEAMRRIALEDPDVRVRAEAVARLARDAATDPSARSALEAVARADESEGVRGFARRALEHRPARSGS